MQIDLLYDACKNNNVASMCKILYGVNTSHYIIVSKIVKPIIFIETYKLHILFSLTKSDECFKLLLLASGNRPYEFYINLFLNLIKNNRLQHIKILKKLRPDILDYPLYNKFVEVACTHYNILILEQLLKWNVNKYTYLNILKHLAIEGNLWFVDVIFRNNTSSTKLLNLTETSENYGIFANACAGGNLVLVEYLIYHVPSRNIIVGFNAAVLYRHSDVILFIASVFPKIPLNTAFNIACEIDDIKILGTLLSICDSDFYKYSIFVQAIDKERLSILEYLLDKYTDLDYKLCENVVHVLNDTLILTNDKILDILSVFDIQCSICLVDTSNMRTLCGHYFHKSCLKKWLEKNASCPNCRVVF
jgi:hypothetical protein